MKLAKWNSDIGRIQQARLKQRAIRHNLGSMKVKNNPAHPTHRTQVAQMSGILDRYRKWNFYRNHKDVSMFGAVTFDQATWATEYNSATNLLDQINYAEVDLESVSFPVDDAPLNDPSDAWAAKVANSSPSNRTLYDQAVSEVDLAIERGNISFDSDTEKINYIITLYKEKYMAKYGRMKKPFSQSTMQMTPPEEIIDERLVSILAKLREIAEARDNMKRALFTVNQDIKFYEEEYSTSASLYTNYKNAIGYMERAGNPYPSSSSQYTNWQETLNDYTTSRTQQQAVRDNAETLLMGDTTVVGLRTQVEQLARGLAALNNQYSALTNSAGMDPDEVDARVADAKKSRPGVWKKADFGVGAGVGAAIVIGLVFLAQQSMKKKGTRRQEGRDPIGIFINSE